MAVSNLGLGPAQVYFIYEKGGEFEGGESQSGCSTIRTLILTLADDENYGLRGESQSRCSIFRTLADDENHGFTLVL